MEDTQQPVPRWISGIEPAKELFSATGTQILELECREQPARLHELIAAYRSDKMIRAELNKMSELASRPGPIFFIGMGASFCSSISSSVLLQTHGRLSFPLDAGEWLYYGLPTRNQAALSVLLTTSGESAE